MTPTSADAIVVGGGPGGSSCARALSQAGMRVLVLDAARFPRDKTCAGWITPAVVDLLALDLAEYRQRHVCQPITGFRTGRMGTPWRETRFGDVVSYGIRRVEFDDYLLRRSGARIVDQTPVTRLRYDLGRWVVNEAFSAPILVGAGGHRCPVARVLGARPADEAAVTAQEIEFPMTPAQAARCPVAPDIPQLSLCEDLKGYGWLVRKGDHLNVGLGRMDAHHLPSHVQRYRAALVSAGIVPPDTPERWKGHAYLLRETSPRAVVGDGVLLVGDAAGLAAAISGEGIRPAVESGLAAARCIVAAGGPYHTDRLRPYEAWLDTRFPRGRHAVIGSVPPAIVNPIVGALLATSWFTRHVLLERWFLQSHAASRATAVSHAAA